MQLNPFIPELSTHAGSCLTMANWQEMGVQTVTYSLASLLIKPGFDFLSSVSSLQHYGGWQGPIVLNATLPRANSQGIYSLRSQYDGSIVSFSQEALYLLIRNLQPELFISPPGFSGFLMRNHLTLPETIKFFIPEEEFHQISFDNSGIFLSYKEKQDFAYFFTQFQKLQIRTTYLQGQFNPLEARELVKQGLLWLETDKPAADALQGKIYDEKSSFDLLASERTHEHQSLMNDCLCPTCSQGLTRAYLHHLFLQTPLLCQRFLIQHNVFYYRNFIENPFT